MFNKPHDESDVEGFPLDHKWLGDPLDKEEDRSLPADGKVPRTVSRQGHPKTAQRLIAG
jgi:hypothetical protein